MPELPDIVVYYEAIHRLFGGQRLQQIRLGNPFLLRTVTPTIHDFAGKRLLSTDRIGKRIVLYFEDDLIAVIHLMIAGRFKIIKAGGALSGKIGLCAFDFETQSLVLTEAGTKRRASLHLHRGVDSLQIHHRGGLEVLDASFDEFWQRLQTHNHTLKRWFTDPRIVSGIGNSYSDEILHHAKQSPFKLAPTLTRAEAQLLYESTIEVLSAWTHRLRTETNDSFPTHITAFRPEMSVHGKFGQPCPHCGTSVQRIVYADNESNYCPRCQTDGKLLADRSLSRLLKADWPKTIEELETHHPSGTLISPKSGASRNR
ncbi:MAG: formamidopyrimidine-DNA glycosylase [Myxococcales bacterium]|nr:formamidopyrimidine-DNA glycosylase [Myxococcales bacterium]